MLVNDALLRIASGELARLVVEWPPRHGKSEFISKHAPAWFVASFGWPVLLASYEYELAASWGAHAREVVRSVGREVFGVGLGRKQAEAWWECTNGGQMISAGVGGPITGKGGRLLIVDDPVKNAEEANSETYRRKSHEWYDSTWRTRLEPGGAMVLTGTRWHQDDLIGYVLAKGDEEWEVIRLPAIAEADDPLGRELGEALWPERYSTAELAQLKASVGSYWWNALYQQAPSSEEGAIFRRGWWQRYGTVPSDAKRGCVTVDTAGWEKDSDGDYCVIAVWRTTGPKFYCVEVQRGRWEFPEVERRLKDTRAAHDLPIVVEETPWSRPLVQRLREQMAGVIPWSVEGRSKSVRALSVQAYAEAGDLYLPESAPWVSEFIDEHANFPFGAHDDQVDTTTMALLYLARGPGDAVDMGKIGQAYVRRGVRV
jgi:predicted phage terminase large subunit-like protein